MRELKREAKITEAFYDVVKPSEGSSKLALFYGRVNIHKEGNPLRPVIATRGTATYTMARKLAYILRLLITSSVRTVRNTKDLVESMEDVSLKEDETEL